MHVVNYLQHKPSARRWGVFLICFVWRRLVHSNQLPTPAIRRLTMGISYKMRRSDQCSPTPTIQSLNPVATLTNLAPEVTGMPSTRTHAAFIR